MALRELTLFAGAGGGILAGEALGFQPVCAVEIEQYPCDVLLARQREGDLPVFPIWPDVTTFDGGEWEGRADLVSGGFPCQNTSLSGDRTGLDGDESGLWREMARIICEVRPAYAWVENSPALTSWGADRVFADLAAMGFDAEWGVLGAGRSCGAPHKRERIWILAAHPARVGLAKWEGQRRDDGKELPPFARSGWWASEPDFSRVVDGVAAGPHED